MVSNSMLDVNSFIISTWLICGFGKTIGPIPINTFNNGKTVDIQKIDNAPIMVNLCLRIIIIKIRFVYVNRKWIIDPLTGS